jgi:iron complex transport system permease protein
MLTALLVLLLARRGRGGQGYRLVLVGIGMGATLSGLNQLLLVTGDLDQALFAQLAGRLAQYACTGPMCCLPHWGWR